MSEYYKFSETKNPSKRLELSESEMKTIRNLGLTFEDLQKLLDGPHRYEGSYALLFESPSVNSNLVVKVWKNPGNDSKRGANENVALRLLRIRGFTNAPKLRGYLQPSTILFEEKIEGDVVNEFDNDHIEQLALALADLHSIKLNAYGKPCTKRKNGTRMDYLLDGIETLHTISEPFAGQTEVMELINLTLDKIRNEANESKDAFSATNFTLIHFDLHKNNILYSKKDGTLIIVDWEQASAGDSAMDIAKLFLKSDFDAEQKQYFLRIYESHQTTKDPHFQERLKVYESFVLINSILWRLGVLSGMPQQMSSDSEGQFYNRVKVNLDKELEVLKNFVSESLSIYDRI